jgi:hypothetical protein
MPKASITDGAKDQHVYTNDAPEQGTLGPPKNSE